MNQSLKHSDTNDVPFASVDNIEGTSGSIYIMKMLSVEVNSAARNLDSIKT